MAPDSVNHMNTRKQHGFSLIELMVVVTIIGILASIAYPNYTQYVFRSKRSEAKVELERRSQALEKCYTRYMSYLSANCTPLAAAGNTANNYYAISAVTPDAVTYTLTATAIGTQANDKKCATLSLSSNGERAYTGTGTMKDCW